MKIHTQNIIRRPLFCTLTALILCAVPSQAQDSSDTEEEEVFELSPFEVSADSDIGYIATSTLAGSRLNARLEDVAASVSVFTKEFMEDIGAKGAGDLLTYTAGTEVAGTRGNFTNGSGAGAQGSVSDIDNIRGGGYGTRIRGLAEADITRNYFQSSVPFDTYNTDRIEVNRGSNAVLFGLGSPAGIINNSTQKAQFKDLGRVRFEVDTFGGVRGEFNVNREIIDNVLAVRVAALHNNRKFEQDDAFQDQERVYLAATFQKDLIGEDNGIWGRTIINANFEDGNIDSNNPRTTPPQDLVTPWFQPYTTGPLGTANFTPKPAWDGHLSRLHGSGEVAYWNSGQPVDPNNATLDNPALQVNFSGMWQRAVALMYQDVNAVQPSYPGGSNLAGAQGRILNWPTDLEDFIEANATGSAAFPFNAIVTDLRTALGEWKGTTTNPGGFTGAGLWNSPVIMDRSIFDFREQLLEGAHNKWEGRDFDVYNLSLQQLFFNDHAGIEYAISEENSENWWHGNIGNRDAITIDINKVLFDGTENPNFGRPVVFSGLDEGANNQYDRNTERLTGFIDLDLRDRDGLIKWLGRHVVTGVISSYEEDRYRVNYATGWSPELSDLHLGNSKDPNQPGNSNVVGVHYLGQSLAGMDSPVGANIPNIQANQKASMDKLSSNSMIRVHRINGVNQNGDPIPDGFRDVTAPGISIRPYEGFTSRSKFDAQSAVLQSYLLKDHLVGTFSWRKDEVDVRTLNNAPKLPDSSGAIVDRDTFNVDGIGDDDALISEKETTTWGFVAKVPNFFFNWTDGLVSGIHGFYNESENFQPSAQRFDTQYRPLDPPSGETKDYGVRISMFEDKLNLKVTKYETSQNNNSASLNWIPSFSAQQFVGVWKQIHGKILNGATYPGHPGYTGVLGYVEGTFNARIDTNGDGVEDLVFPEPPDYYKEWYGMEYDGTKQWTFAANNSAVFTQDVAAEGVEIELTYNPLPNWRIAFNATQQEAVQTGAGEIYDEWLNEVPFWDTDLDGEPDTPFRTGVMENYKDVPRNNTSKIPFFFNTWFDPWFSRVTVNNGQPNPEIAKWSWNFITNYRFTDGRLKGLGVGGSVRWREATSIGYGVQDEDAGKLEFNKVILGDDYLRFQLWFDYTIKDFEVFNTNVNWNIRVNIRNLLNDKDLIPVQANPDGQITGVRVGEPRVFEIVNTFTF